MHLRDYHDKRSTRIAYDTAHGRGKTNDRTDGDIDLTHYQDVSHRQHQEYLSQIDRHLTEHAT